MKKEISSSLGNVYRFRTTAEEVEALEIIQKIVAPFDLTAQILPPDIMSRGTQGDEPTYTRVVLLTGANPGWDVLSDLSIKISNSVPINRVLF